MNEDSVREKIQYLNIEIGGYSRLLPETGEPDTGNSIARTLQALKIQRDKLLRDLGSRTAMPAKTY